MKRIWRSKDNEWNEFDEFDEVRTTNETNLTNSRSIPNSLMIIRNQVTMTRNDGLSVRFRMQQKPQRGGGIQAGVKPLWKQTGRKPRRGDRISYLHRDDVPAWTIGAHHRLPSPLRGFYCCDSLKHTIFIQSLFCPNLLFHNYLPNSARSPNSCNSLNSLLKKKSHRSKNNELNEFDELNE